MNSLEAHARIRDAMKVGYGDNAGRLRSLLWVITLTGLASAPFWADRQTLRVLTEVFSYMAIASLWNMLAGYAGIISAGQQLYVGVGGYIFYLWAFGTSLNPLTGTAVAAILGFALAIPIALLLFKLRGPYFTIGSWVIAEVFEQLAEQISVVGGGSGISLPAMVVKSIAVTRSEREHLIYWLFLGVVAGITGAIWLLLRTREGLALMAMRDNEVAAQSVGINVHWLRVVIYVVTSAAAAAVGSLIFLQKLSITPASAFSINEWTVNIIFIVVIGGVGRMEGPIVGTIIFFVLRQYLSDLGSIYLIILGAVSIVVMLLAPNGLWGTLAARWHWELFSLSRRLTLAETPTTPDRPSPPSS